MGVSIMRTQNRILAITSVLTVLSTGCAVPPEVEDRREAILADIDEIISLPLDPAEFGETERCLSEGQYRSFRPLGDRHMLFEGRRDKYWINTLVGRCPTLDRGDVLVMRPTSSGRMCDKDRFEARDRSSRTLLETGPSCALGMFHPVSKAQVEEIEALLEQW